jgi:hypothetical protein
LARGGVAISRLCSFAISSGEKNLDIVAVVMAAGFLAETFTPPLALH